MASCRILSFPAYLVLLSLLLLLLFGSSPSSASRSIRRSASASDKVSLGLYYESLCPYSANFIVNYLNDLIQDDDLLSVVDIYLSPWGNAKLTGDDTFSCQHGPMECLLNTVEACAIHVWPQLEQHFPFIYCVESLVYQRNYTQWESCFDELGLDRKPIDDCYNSGYGKELELQYAAETNALQPPHQYVPWVVVDGQPLYEDYENFLIYICQAYKGTAAPEACNQLSRNIIKKLKEQANVCYKKAKLSTPFEQIRSAMQ